MLPIFHPTTTILVDDVKSYLDALQDAAPFDQPLKTFLSPEKAIEYIRERNRTSSAVFRKLMRISGDTENLVSGNKPIQEQVLRLSISSLPDKIMDPGRFDEVSVVICDYAMPSMKGTDFFERLGPIPQKRILLTGEADETIAVKAFNDGLIDQFVTKGQPGAVKRLFELVKRFQRDYFSQQYSFLLSRFWSTDSIFARPGFEQLVQSLYGSEFVEHYYVNFPDGALLVGGGQPKRLVAMHDDDYETLLDIVRESADTEPEFVQALEARAVVVHEGRGNGIFGDFREWRQMVAPSVRFASESGSLYYGLFDAGSEIDMSSAALYLGGNT